MLAIIFQDGGTALTNFIFFLGIKLLIANAEIQSSLYLH